MTRFVLLALVSLLNLSACSSGDDGSRPTSTPELPAVEPLPECPDIDYTPCDIAEGACQERLWTLAACVRQTDPVSNIDIELLSTEQARQLFEQDLADFPEPAVDHFERALSVLLLADPAGTSRDEALDAKVDFVWGQYRSDEKRLIIIDHGEPADSASVNALMVHEMIHALQDADYDLTSWPEGGTPTFDSYLATDSVIEGEAKFYQIRVGAPLLGIDIDSLDFDSVMQEHLDYTLGQLYGGTTLYGSSFRTFPYGFGAIQAFDAWSASGPRGIDALFASPPTSTRQILAALLEGDHEPVEIIEIPEPTVTTIELDSHDTLGAWGLNLFLGATEAEPSTLTELALAWRGDHLWVYANSLNRTFGLWQLEMASKAAAARMDDTFEQLGLAHGTSGTRVFASFSTGSDSTELLDWGNAWLAE